MAKCVHYKIVSANLLSIEKKMAVAFLSPCKTYQQYLLWSVNLKHTGKAVLGNYSTEPN